MQSASHGIRQHDLDVTVHLFQITAHSRQGAAGTGGGHKGIHPAIGLMPDFRPGRLVVGQPVGGVVELIGPDRAGQ